MPVDLSELIAISRKYGSDPDYVLAGGGNTSMKDAATLYVKASGRSLGAIDESGFIAIDRKKLEGIWSAVYPEDAHSREKAVLADLLAARSGGGENARPSVETLMHGLLPSRFAVHTHPCLVNGITCGRDGEKAAHRLLGDLACWVPLVDPGYLLARAVNEAICAFRAGAGRIPLAVLMQNHGLVVSGDTPQEIDAVTSEIVSRIRAELKRKPDLSPIPFDAQEVEDFIRVLRPLLPGRDSSILFETNAEVARLVASREAMAPVASAFSPDHIVYAGQKPLFVNSPADVGAAWEKHASLAGAPPRIVAAMGLGFFACADSAIRAAQARDLFLDSVKVSVYAESFGGPLFLPKRMIDFIATWEAEVYRSRVSGG